VPLWNLATLRTRVEEELRYAPDAAAYRDNVSSLLNEAQAAFLGLGSWRFMMREARLFVRPKVVIPAAEWSWENNYLYSVLVQSGAGTEFNDVVGTAALASDDIMAYWGQGLSGDKGSGALWGPTRETGVEWMIEATESLGSSIRFFLDPRYAHTGSDKTTVNASTQNLTIRPFRLALPLDFAEIIAVTDRGPDLNEDRPLARAPGWLPQWDAGASGPPAYWDLVADGGIQSSASLLRPVGLDRGGADMPCPLAPVATPTVTATAGAGLTSGVKYSYCYTWAYGGQESGPSEVVSVTPTGGNLQVTLGNLETSDQFRYRQRLVYRREGEGPWYLLTVISSQTDTSYVDSAGTPSPLGAGKAAHRRLRLLRHRSAPVWMRVYPWPADARELMLTYYAQAADMVAPTDVPEIPEEYAPLLALHAAAAQAERNGNGTLGVQLRERAAPLLSACINRYMIADQSTKVRQSFLAGNQLGGFWPTSQAVRWTSS